MWFHDANMFLSCEGIKQGVLLVVVAVVEEGDSETNWAVQESKGDESKV
ncbi:hypothetical protein Tco_0946229, partial [Tanacetum coccineum]